MQCRYYPSPPPPPSVETGDQLSWRFRPRENRLTGGVTRTEEGAFLYYVYVFEATDFVRYNV